MQAPAAHQRASPAPFAPIIARGSTSSPDRSRTISARYPCRAPWPLRHVRQPRSRRPPCRSADRLSKRHAGNRMMRPAPGWAGIAHSRGGGIAPNIRALGKGHPPPRQGRCMGWPPWRPHGGSPGRTAGDQFAPLRRATRARRRRWPSHARNAPVSANGSGSRPALPTQDRLSADKVARPARRRGARTLGALLSCRFSWRRNKAAAPRAAQSGT